MPGSRTDRVGSRARGHHPALVAAIVAFLGGVLLFVLLTALGLLLTHVLAHGPVGRWDARVNRWFVARRTPAGNTWSAIGSELGSTPIVLGAGALALLLLAIARRWRALGLVLTALFVEFAVFLATSVLVDRPRPPVPRLEVAPPTSSFPSGHVAASIALFGGLAIVVVVLARAVALRVIAWLIAVVVPVAVGIARVYRGEHHVTDVLASLLLGWGALAVAFVAIRIASGAHRRRVNAPGSWNGSVRARA